MRRLPALLLLLALAACSDDPAPRAGAGPSPSASLPADRVRVQAGGVSVVAEVADTEQERAVGLMRRTSVPRGTGMVFLYDAPSTGRYYMFDVPVPLTAVFAREGKVVGVVDMPPCRETDPYACPTYGPDAPFDTVLETAPETVEGVVQVGDAVTVTRRG